MIKPTGGKIFLADQRGVCKTEKFKRYSTFNFGSFYHEHKQPSGSLYMWNEEMLAGSQQTVLNVATASHVIIIPVTGGVQVTDPQGITSTVQVEEVQVQTIAANSSIQFINPYESEIITFLVIGIQADVREIRNVSRLCHFDFNAIENQLAPVVELGNENNAAAYPFHLRIGRFGGRQEAAYQLTNTDAGFFAFVLGGAFEIEGRLLHEKDGIALWNYREVELEALSNHAIVFIIELKA